MKSLDDLKIDDVNSTTIFQKKLGAPLGFFNAGFPKGEYKRSVLIVFTSDDTILCL